MTHYSAYDAPMFIANTDYLHADYRRKKMKNFLLAFCLSVFSVCLWLWVSHTTNKTISILFGAITVVTLGFTLLMNYCSDQTVVNEADQISIGDLNDLIQIIQDNQHDKAIMASINLINAQNRRPYIAEARKIREYVESKNFRKSQIRDEQGVMEVFRYLANQKPA